MADDISDIAAFYDGSVEEEDSRLERHQLEYDLTWRYIVMKRMPEWIERRVESSKEGTMKLTIRPLTPDVWPALEDLFDDNGPCSRCWCMYGRIGAAYRKRPRDENKAAFREIVMRGPPPGLLAFHGDVAVGWCQLTPRDALPWLDRVRQLKRVDDVPVWSISCLYVRKGYRRQGVTSALIAAAVKAARDAQAPALEAYPFDADVSPSASGSGYASTFARAGFKTIARRIPARPIMRLDLKATEQ